MNYFQPRPNPVNELLTKADFLQLAAESSSVSEAEEDLEGNGRVQPSSRLVPVQVPSVGGRPLTVSNHQLLAAVPAGPQASGRILAAGPHIVRFYKTSSRGGGDLSKSSSAIEETVLRLKVV